MEMFSTGTMTSPLGLFLEGETGSLTYPIPVFAIEHPEGLVVVDAGLHPDLARGKERLGDLDSMFQVQLPSDGSGTVGPLLSSSGYDPNQVALIILTHLHFDHAGGLIQLPNARIIVQSKEWEARHDEAAVESGAYNPNDFDLGHDCQEIEGDYDVFDDGSITCLLTDGHTAGHQSVRVRTVEGTFVICGDCCYLRKTLTNEHLPPSGLDRRRQVEAVRRMAREQSDGASLIFGHDPEQYARITSHGLSAGV